MLTEFIKIASPSWILKPHPKEQATPPCGSTIYQPPLKKIQ